MKTKRRLKPPADFTIHKVTVLLRDIPRDLRDGFKAYCARRGISMKQRLCELMALDVNEELKSMKRARKRLEGE